MNDPHKTYPQPSLRHESGRLSAYFCLIIRRNSTLNRFNWVRGLAGYGGDG